MYLCKQRLRSYYCKHASLNGSFGLLMSYWYFCSIFTPSFHWVFLTQIRAGIVLCMRPEVTPALLTLQCAIFRLMMDSQLKGPTIQNFGGFFVVSWNKLLNKQLNFRLFETSQRSCDAIAVGNGYFLYFSAKKALMWNVRCSHETLHEYSPVTWSLWQGLLVCFGSIILMKGNKTTDSIIHHVIKRLKWLIGYS